MEAAAAGVGVDGELVVRLSGAEKEALGVRGGPCDAQKTSVLLDKLFGPMSTAQSTGLLLAIALAAEAAAEATTGSNVAGSSSKNVWGPPAPAIRDSSRSPLLDGDDFLRPMSPAKLAAGEVTKSFRVDMGCIGAIIGKGGAVLNQMREQTGCQMNVSGNNARSSLPPGTVVLKGTERQVQVAETEIQQKVEAAGYSIRY
jgi:hypothetical protein